MEWRGELGLSLFFFVVQTMLCCSTCDLLVSPEFSQSDPQEGRLNGLWLPCQIRIEQKQQDERQMPHGSVPVCWGYVS